MTREEYRSQFEKDTGEDCLHVHTTICGNEFKYFNIEYVKQLETKLLSTNSGEGDIKKCEDKDNCRNLKHNACSTCKRQHPYCQGDWFKPIN
jgi:hypothetical protein